MHLFRILLATGVLLATAAVKADDSVYAEMKTNFGMIVLQLDKTKAPISVENFEQYANSGYYNGTVFHRVIPTFMIQGGGFDFHGNYPAGLHQKPGTKAPIKNEWQNGLKNTRGTIAMARTNDPNSATSQFFINLSNNTFLDQGHDRQGNVVPDGPAYAVFGKVISGMDTVDRIKVVKTMRMPNGMSDVPAEEVMIESVTIVSEAQAKSAEARNAADLVKSIEAKIAELEAQLEAAKKKAAQLKSQKE
jgi:cyclophilin family peptidyl-prolyl cis-trans isomerase